MIEKNPIREIRLEFSRKTGALYPEWSSLFSRQEFERQFFNRCKRYGKESGLSLSGSPNHGEQWWTYDGISQLFSISNALALPEIQEKKWTRIDKLFTWLQTDTIALFTPLDLRNANSIAALPKAFRKKYQNLMSWLHERGTMVSS